MLSKTGKKRESPLGISPSVVFAELVRCGLRDRMIGGLVRLNAKGWRVVFLQSGELNLKDALRDQTIAAPALLWIPIKEHQRLRVRAGSVGAQIVISERGVNNAVGRRMETLEMRSMQNQFVLLRLADQPELMLMIQHALDMILRETERPATASDALIEAQIRVLMIHLWRNSTLTIQSAQAPARPTKILQQFRQLLEVNFTQRWNVNDYADALGVLPDRLHSICTRSLGKTPLRLIHERTLYEAELFLTRSTMSIDQIAEALGFHSAGQFNKFFKSMTQTPPGKFRKEVSRDNQDGEEAEIISFENWP